MQKSNHFRRDRIQVNEEYVKERGNTGGARRDLEDLRAAISHHASENLHRAIVNVWLPPKEIGRAHV